MSGEGEKQGRGPIHDPFTIQQFEKVENARALFEQYAPGALVRSARWETLQVLPGAFCE